MQKGIYEIGKNIEQTPKQKAYHEAIRNKKPLQPITQPKGIKHWLLGHALTVALVAGAIASVGVIGLLAMIIGYLIAWLGDKLSSETWHKVFFLLVLSVIVIVAHIARERRKKHKKEQARIFRNLQNIGGI